MNLAEALANLVLLASALGTSVSGLVIQAVFHLGAATRAARASMEVSALGALDGPALAAWGLDRAQWGLLHKVSALAFALLLVRHITLRRAWYARLLRRENRSDHLQLLCLPVLMVLVALTGLAPWGLSMSGSLPHLRFLLVEMHDKLALPLILLLLLHVVQRVQRPFPRFPAQGRR